MWTIIFPVYLSSLDAFVNFLMQIMTVLPRINESATGRTQAQSFLIQDTILFPGKDSFSNCGFLDDILSCACCYTFVRGVAFFRFLTLERI